MPSRRRNPRTARGAPRPPAAPRPTAHRRGKPRRGIRTDSPTYTASFFPRACGREPAPKRRLRRVSFQPLLEAGPGAVEPRFYRPLRHTQGPGDLVVAEPLHLAQQDDLPVLL